MREHVNGVNGMGGQVFNEDTGESREGHTVDGRPDGLFDGADGTFNFWDMVVSGADGEIYIWEGALSGGEFAIGMDGDRCKSASAVQGQIRGDTLFDGWQTAVSQVATGEVTEVPRSGE